MFWKKEKPKFEIRPLYSIREELSPFYIGCSLPRKLDELWKACQRMEEKEKEMQAAGLFKR